MNGMSLKAKIVIQVLFIALLVVGLLWYLRASQNEVKMTIETQLEESKERLVELANTAGNTRVGEMQQVVTDCSQRDRYESLLQDLRALSAAELNEVRSLHQACGGYFSTVRLFMAHKLETQVMEYERQLALYKNVAYSNDLSEYKLEEWRSLASKESARAGLLKEQNAIQGQIINAFADGDQVRVDELLEKAQAINGSLNVTSIQINNERAALVSS